MHSGVMSSAFDIEDYLLENLAGVKASAGKELKAPCPECGKAEFYVNRESGSHYCFKCGLRGRNIVALVAKIEGLEYYEATQFVFKRAVPLRRAIALPKLSERIRRIRGVAEIVEEKPVSESLPKEFRACYKGGAWQLPAYLKERRIKSSTAREWNLGFCKSGRYANRLVIPIICPSGTSFTARDMGGTSSIRYLNPAEADHRRLLIGWNMARLTGDLVICEGPLDAVKLWQHSISNVALGGKVLHDEQMAQIVDLSPDIAVTVMLDPEEEEAPMVAAQRLSAHFTKVYIAKLPLGIDPGKSSRRQAYEALDNALLWKGGRAVALSRLAKSRAAIISRSRKKVTVS